MSFLLRAGLQRFSILRSSTLILALLLLACSHPRSPAASPRGDTSSDDPLATTRWRPSGEQPCRVIPPGVTSVQEVIDSAGFADLIESGDILRDGHVLWTIAFDDAGTPVHLRTLEYTVAREAGLAVQEELWRLLRPQSAAVRVRLRLDVASLHADSTPLVRLRIGGIQHCDSRLQNIDAVRRALGAVQRRGVVEVGLLIDREGVVEDYEIVSSSGNETTDRMALGFVTGLRYDPAYVERVAVPSRTTYEVVFH